MPKIYLKKYFEEIKKNVNFNKISIQFYELNEENFNTEYTAFNFLPILRSQLATNIFVYKIPYRRALGLAALGRVRRASKGILHTTNILIANFFCSVLYPMQLPCQARETKGYLVYNVALTSAASFLSSKYAKCIWLDEYTNDWVE